LTEREIKRVRVMLVQRERECVCERERERERGWESRMRIAQRTSKVPVDP
jgi:hypothetical protein